MIPKVTVISAVYNLIRCKRIAMFLQMADSVKRQMYPNVEHIIIDGGSTDGTQQFLEASSGEYGFTYVSEPDNGVYFAMNKGARMAHGEYVAFLNSDDYWHSSRAIAESIRRLEEEGADFSYAEALVIRNEKPCFVEPCNLGAFFIRMPFCHQTMFVRKEAFDKLGGFRAEKFKSAGDFDFINRLILSKARGVRVNLNFTTYRLGGMSDVMQVNSEAEVVKSMLDNLGPFDRNLDIDLVHEMYRSCHVKSSLFELVRSSVNAVVASEMDSLRLNSTIAQGLIHFTVPEKNRRTVDEDSISKCCDIRTRLPSVKLRRALDDMGISKGIKARKLLYIGHSYHRKTHSTDFLVDILSREYEVSRLDLDPDDDSSYNRLAQIRNCDYDVLVVFQLMPSIRKIRRAINFRKGVFFPMYDYYQPVADVSKPIWKEYRGFLIINFSKTVHNEVSAAGYESRYIQYFPKPADEINWGDEKSVFFWQRINQVNPAQILRAMANIDFSHLHVHQVPDPGHAPQPIPDVGKDITVSKWYDTREEMRQEMLKSAIYVAPRFYEGIGMGFLEAMANGRCVVSADGATMTEYITSGENGLLYDLWEAMKEGRDIKPMEKPALSIRQLQRNAYDTACRGYKTWCERQDDILMWIDDFSPGDVLRRGHVPRVGCRSCYCLLKKSVRVFLKSISPYWLMREWLEVKYGMRIDEPVFAYEGKAKRLRRIVKFMLPYAVVKMLKKMAGKPI